MSLILMVGFAVGISTQTTYADDAGTSSTATYVQGVEYYVAMDGAWQRVSMGTELTGRENIIKPDGSEGPQRYYTTPADLEKVYGKFGFKADSYNGERIFPHTADSDTEQVWADTVPYQKNGEWHVPLAKAEKIYVYYLPANTEGHLSYFEINKQLSDPTLLEENMFYSITISDPDKLTKLPDIEYVRKGKDYKVTLPTQNGYKWKCLDRISLQEIEPTETIQSEDEVTYVFKDIDQGIKIEPVSPKNDKIVINYDAATVRDNLEKLSEVAPSIQEPEQNGKIQGAGNFKVTLSKSETQYKLLRVDNQKVRVKIPGSSKDKKYWYTFKGWRLGDTGTIFQPGDTLSVKELKSYEVNGEIKLSAVWKGRNDNGRVGSCNFYLNKTCEIVDNTTNGFQDSPMANYTKAIYTSKVNEDNDLKVDGSGNLNMLAPKDSTNAYEVDSQIRKLTKTPYEGISMEEFPSDEEVLANLRANYDEKDPIKVGNRVIPKEELTTESFKVRWASFKYVRSDGWHVDGILVAKEGKLVVQKTFTGSAETAIDRLKDKFNITVKHYDNPEADDPAVDDYKLVTKSKSEAGSGETGYDSYNEETHTFTWNLIVRDYQQYQIEENDYKVADFDNSSHTYSIRNTDNSDESKVSTQESDWKPYNEDEGVYITANAYPDDIPTTAYQTVSFRNMYVTSNIITIDKMDDFTINGMKNVKFKVTSVDEPDTFQLWRRPGTNFYSYEKNTEPQWGSTEQVADGTVETDKTGLVQMRLKPGDYILKEQVPEGYQARPAFRITVDEHGDIAEAYLCDEDGERMDGTLNYLTSSPHSSIITLKNHSEELTSVTAQAKMNDVKADSVEVELWCNGSKMSGSQYTQTLSASNDWKYTWKNLPLYADGKVANYTLRETRLGDVSYDPGTNTDGFGDYIVTYDKCKYREADSGEYNDPASWTDDNGKKHYSKHALLVVNNKNEVPEERFVKVKAQVQWNDGNNQDGIRPDLVDMKLYDSDGDPAGNALELNSDNEWTANYVDLDKYKNNKEVGYQITDKSFQVPDQYTAEITGDMVNGFVIVLTHTPKNETLSGVKKWNDQDDKASVRPDQITVDLLADGEKVDQTTVTADDNWNFQFTSKPVYKDGEKIHYTVQEADVTNYTPAYSTDDDGNFIITNNYAPSSVKLTGDTALRATTVVTGKDSIEAFRIELSPAEDYGDAVKMPETSSVTTADKIAKDSSEQSLFAPVEITKAGTYTFHVKTTTKATKAGWIYDNDTKTLTVKVVDQNGKLVVDEGESTLSAVATHSFHAAALEGDTAITIQKTLTGRSMWGDEKFNFTLSPADDATKKAVSDGDITLAEDQASVSKMKDGETATVSFGRAEFKEEGTYTFQAKEERGSKPGMTYDTEPKTITVKVSGENGILKATQENVPTFKNVYRASGSFTPQGTKTLLSPNGSKLSIKENQFKFSVRYLGEDSSQPLITGTTGSGKDAPINFGTLTYSIADLEKLVPTDYVYKIVNDNMVDYIVDYVVTEEPTGKDSLQQNTQTQNFSVTYRDLGDGKLEAMTTGGKSISFENRYVTDTATVSMDGSKVLEGRDLAKDEFSFHITSDDANAPMPKETTVKNDASGNVSFGDITYTKDDIGDGESKTFTYKITESGSQPGVTNDSETKTIKVTVKDDGEGHITAETEPGDAPLFAFTNKYSAAPTESAVTDSVKVKKVLEGGNLTEGQFQFVMKDESKDVVAKVSNKAGGSIDFPALKFTEAGTYNYTIAEEAGDSTHVTYDDTVYNVTASVTDDYEGKLHVKWNCGVSAISFHNVYTATPVSVNPQAVKTIAGDTPESKETFHFALSGVSVDGDTSKMPPMPEASKVGTKTVEIEGEGTGYFGPITFEKAGTYQYQVVEETGSNANYTYDTTVYELTYVVTDRDGDLQVEDSIQALPENKAVESVIFTNKYRKPTDPTPNPNPNPGKGDNGNNGTHGNHGQNGKNGTGGHSNGGNTSTSSHVSSHTPQTGDDSNTGFFLGLMGVSSAMLAGVTVLRKKRA